MALVINGVRQDQLMEGLRSEALKGLQTTSRHGDEYRQQAQQAMESYIQKPPTFEGGAPELRQFASIVTQNEGLWSETPAFQLDEEGYQRATFDWMRNNEKYTDWSDQQIQDFVQQTALKGGNERMAAEFWQNQNVAWEQAKEQSAADRAKILSELESFREGYGSDYLEERLSSMRRYIDADIQQTLRGVQNQFASMGRTASPYLLGHMARRLQAQGEDQLFMKQIELQGEVDTKKQFFLSMMNDVLKNTQHQTMDPLAALQIMQEFGKGSSTVSAGGSSGGSKSSSGGVRILSGAEDAAARTARGEVQRSDGTWIKR